MQAKTSTELISGGFGGIAGVIGSHPYDTVKCRIQVHPEAYRNGFHCFTEIIMKERFRGLYKGVLPPVVMQGAINAIVFSVQSPISAHLHKTMKGGTWNEVKIGFYSGMAAGFAQTFVCAPMELVKIRTQHQAIGKATDYQGNLSTLRDIYHRGRVRGCYQGFAVTALRDTPAFGVYFAVYEGLMHFTATRNGIAKKDLSNIFPFAYGGLAGVLSWLLNFPIDTVKSKFQMDGADGAGRKYQNARDCFMKLWRLEGPRRLYSGLATALLRAFANSAFLFPAYENTKRLLN